MFWNHGYGVLCFSCCPPSLQKYKEYEKDVAIEEIDGLQLVKKLAKNMEEMFHKKSEAVRVSASGFCCVLPKDIEVPSGNWELALMTPALKEWSWLSCSVNTLFSLINQQES